MNEIFNTSFEAEMRVLLVLHVIGRQGAFIDRITAYDFMSVYAKDFDIFDSNLHGNNSLKFSELPSQRNFINNGIREAVLDGLIAITQTSDGFLYTINNTGAAFVQSLHTNYSQQYIRAAAKIHCLYGKLPDATVMEYVNTKAITNLRR